MKTVEGGRYFGDADLRLPGHRGSATHTFDRRTVDGKESLLARHEHAGARRVRRWAEPGDLKDGVPERILREDNRKRVLDTLAYPFSTICALDITTKAQKTFHGTGALIGARLVLTAGHNVHFKADGGFMHNIVVYPGLNGNRQTPPFGSVMATRFFTVQAWTEDQDQQFDIGAVVLPTPLGEQAGWLSVGKFTTGTLRNLATTHAGYPTECPDTAADCPDDASTMWMDDGNVRVEPNRLLYVMDTTEGHSGGPVWGNFPDKPDAFQLVGVHNYGFEHENAATRINDAVFARIVEWLDRSEP